MGAAMLRAEGLHIGRNGRTLLRFTDFWLSPGEQCLVAGKSGCGKSTLLFTLAGMIPPVKGEISIFGKVINTMSETELDAWRGVNTGFIFQALHLLPLLSVEDNLRLAFFSAGLPIEHARIQTVLERLGLWKLRHRMPATLSQGQSQRVAIARAVVHLPKLILADEPTSSLDDENAVTIMELLKDMAREANAALMVSTHDNRIKPQFDRQLALHGADA